MKRLAVGVLGLTLGCNQIFGLKDTRTWDAAVDAPPPVPHHTYLVWGIGQLQASGAPDSTIDYLGIGFEQSRPEAPHIQVGPELDATGDASLSDVMYDASPRGTELFPGGFDVPDALLGQHWRMVYTMPGDPLPHEVQWTVSSAYLVIPRLTRRDAPPVPANSGYSISPVGGPTLVAPIVMTSGVWTWSDDQHYLGSTFLMDFSDAQPLTGPAGAPEVGKGDWVLVTDWTSHDTNESSVAGWAVTQDDLAAGLHQEPMEEPTWMTPAPTVVHIMSNALSCQRMTSALPDFATVTTCPMGSSVLEYGLLPAPSLPGFAADGRPLVLPLDIATTIKSTLTVVDTSLPLPHVLYSKLVADRTYASAKLESSLEVVTQDVNGVLDYPAPLTTDEQLTDEAGAATMQLGTDGQALSVTGDVLLFKYTFESSYTVDEVEVTLFELAGGALAPIREYIVPDASTSVRIDRSLLKSGHTYVFRSVTHHGYPNTGNGDFRAVTYPFGQSTKFSGAFTVP